ncbi:hypothetical protein J7T55_002847 [Diaporthe amygdali]|uniref:uncharacterized protein n=1 Tax=Phomopsis amygdali TaxID=1214568 RepID=UPI0022FE083F|nr:uncharacterized protein J7T55_002847 [Diaporthe amygdali]KAJ0122334.1 hypothetical protein J7T55_002847 [Diaporthe amygdali]
MNRRSIEPLSALPSARGSKSQQGRWGSACAVCATAKAKCLRSSDDPGTPCDRKTSQLEERLNGLVDLLRASGEYPSDETRARQSSSSQLEDEQGSSQGPSPISSSTAGNVIHIPQTWNRHAPPRCICRAQAGDVPLQRRPDDELLEIYRNRLTPVFPFVVIPPDTTSERLKAERPFLFSAICMSASISDVNSMRGQMVALTQRLMNEMMVESNRSMDLLLGILVMLAWYQNHCLMHAQLNNLLHLAQALLADLGLNRSPEVQERSNVMVLNPPAPNRTTNEDRRAILGVWFLSSSVATGLMKALPMRFSRYIKQCLEDLEKASEHESDLLLVHLVKIQRLTERIHNWTSQEDEEDDVSAILKAPPAAYQVAFHGEIGRLQASLPASLTDNRLLQVYFAFVTLHLNEPPPIDAGQLKKLADSLNSVTLHGPSSLDSLYRAQSALKGFFEKWFEMPTDFYTAMPIFVMLEVVYGITMLARWAKLLGPGQARRGNTAPDILIPQKIVWDPSAVRPSPNSTFGAGLAPLQSFEKSSDVETQSKKVSTASRGSGLAKLPPPITDPTQISATQFREVADPTIPSVVASLRAKLQIQPGLNIDIIGILASLAQRCEQVHRELTEEGTGGAWQNDVWYLCSKKVLITRAKLEKWAEIIAVGGVSTERTADAATKNTSERNDIRMADSGMAADESQATHGRQPVYNEENTLAAFQKQMEMAGQGVMPPGSIGDNWQFDSIWTNEMFDQLDPAMWLNDGNDWEMALLGPIQDNQFGL